MAFIEDATGRYDDVVKKQSDYEDDPPPDWDVHDSWSNWKDWNAWKDWSPSDPGGGDDAAPVTEASAGPWWGQSTTPPPWEDAGPSEPIRAEEWPDAGRNALRGQYQVAGLGAGGMPPSDAWAVWLGSQTGRLLSLFNDMIDRRAARAPDASGGLSAATSGGPDVPPDRTPWHERLFGSGIEAGAGAASAFDPGELQKLNDWQLAFGGMPPGAVGQRDAGGGIASRSSAAAGGVGREPAGVQPEQGPPPNPLEQLLEGLRGFLGWKGTAPAAATATTTATPTGTPPPPATASLGDNPELAYVRRWQDQYRPAPKPAPTATSTLIPTDSLYFVWQLSDLPENRRRTPTPGETLPAGGMSQQNKWNDTIMREVQEQFRDVFADVPAGIAQQQYIQIAKLVKRQIARESRYDPNAIRIESNRVYKGLMQIGDSAFDDVKNKPRLEGFSADDLWKPEKNIPVGVAYLRLIWDKLVQQDKDNFKGGTSDAWRPVDLTSPGDVRERLKLVFAGYTAGYADLLGARRDGGKNARSWASVQNVLDMGERRRSDAINYVTDIFNPYQSNRAPSSTPVPSRTPTPTRTRPWTATATHAR